MSMLTVPTESEVLTVHPARKKVRGPEADATCSQLKVPSEPYKRAKAAAATPKAAPQAARGAIAAPPSPGALGRSKRLYFDGHDG